MNINKRNHPLAFLLLCVFFMPGLLQADLLDSMANGVSDALKTMKKPLQMLVSKGDVPQTIAVLPVTGKGTDSEKEELRIAIHNQLSSKKFRLKKPYDVDHRLAYIKAETGHDFAELSNAELSKKLGVDGVVLVNMDKIEKLYAAAYAHYAIDATIRLFSLPAGKIIWDAQSSVAEREGGISLNPLSMIASAIFSANVLSDSVRLALMDELAREIAADIPQPETSLFAMDKALKIERAISNASDGPFRSGDEITIFMKAEPGLIATFDLGTKHLRNVLKEQVKGEYIGRYIVAENDNDRDITATIHVQRVNEDLTVDWRVPGRFTLDTVVPEKIQKLEANPVKAGILLSWKRNADLDDSLNYVIERADVTTGAFEKLASVNVTEYTDRTAKTGEVYYYRLHVQDKAGNVSPYTEIKVDAVGTGPTTVEEDLLGQQSWYAVSSPYIVKGHVRILRNALLTIQPGVLVRFEPGASLEVLGKIEAEGTDVSPISFSGENWLLSFQDTGKSRSIFSHTRFSGSRQGIRLANASVVFKQVSISDTGTALAVSADASLTLENVQLFKNKVALEAGRGQYRLADVKFWSNKTAIRLTAGDSLSWQANNVRLTDNTVHINAREKVEISGVWLDEVDFPEAMVHIKGPVSLDWDSLPAKKNLLVRWKEKQWQQFYLAHSSDNHDVARAELQALVRQAGDKKAEIMLLALGAEGENKRKRNQYALTRILDKSGTTDLWVQSVKLPVRKNTRNVEHYLVKQSVRRFWKDYLKEKYPELKITRRELKQLKKKGQNLKEIIRESEVLFSARQGPYTSALIAYAIDQNAVNQSLELAGLAKGRELSLVVGVVNTDERSGLGDTLVKMLGKNNITPVILGQQAVSPQLLQRAVKMGVDVIIAAAMEVEASTSALSSKLNVIDTEVLLTLYKTGQKRPFARYKSSASATGFSRKQSIKKTIRQAVNAISNDIRQALYKLDQEKQSL